jgi:hypothetical protein
VEARLIAAPKVLRFAEPVGLDHAGEVEQVHDDVSPS